MVLYKKVRASLFLPNGKFICFQLEPKSRNYISHQKEQIKYIAFISVPATGTEC